MSNYSKIIMGDKPKLTIHTSPIGGVYHLADIDWRVEFYASRGSVVITKNQAVKVDDDTYTVRVDTLKIGTGKLYGILYPSIPDSEVEGGYYVPPVPFVPTAPDGTQETIVSPYNIYNDGM